MKGRERESTWRIIPRLILVASSSERARVVGRCAVAKNGYTSRLYALAGGWIGWWISCVE